MRRFLKLTWPLWLAGVVLASFYLRPGTAQERPPSEPVEVRDLAALFPAQTAAYLETKDIKATAQQVKALLKGSFFEDMPASIEKFMPDDRDFYAGYEFRMYGLFFSPEAFDEASRIKGGAIALLDTPKDFRTMPNMLGVLLTGDSNFTHLMVRSLLNMSRMRSVATVEGVRIYRERPYRDNFRDKDRFDFKDKAKEDPESDEARMERSGPALALLPGAIVIGSKTKEVSDMIRRLKGQKVGATLASQAEFKKHAGLRKDPGLFAYANFETVVGLGAELFAPRHSYKKPGFKDKDFRKDDFKDFDFKDKPKADKFEQVNAQGGGGPGGRQNDPMADLYASLSASFKTLAAGLSLKEGTLDFLGTLRMDQGAKSAWPEFFTARTLDFELFNYVPADSRFTMALAMPKDMKFWDKLGKAAPILETELAGLLNLVDIDKIVQVAAIDRNLPGDGRGREQYQFIVETTDADAAKALAAAQIKGKFTVASKGKFAAFGQDRKSLTDLLDAGAAGKGLFSQAKVAKAVKAHEGAHALLVWSWGQQIAHSVQKQIRGQGEEDRLRELERKQRDLFDKDKKDGEVAFGQPGPDGGPGDPLKRLERITKDLGQAVENLPPFVLSLTRKDDQLLISGKQSNLQGSTARLIDLMMELQMSHRYRGGRPDPTFEDFRDKDGFKDKK